MKRIIAIPIQIFFLNAAYAVIGFFILIRPSEWLIRTKIKTGSVLIFLTSFVACTGNDSINTESVQEKTDGNKVNSAVYKNNVTCYDTIVPVPRARTPIPIAKKKSDKKDSVKISEPVFTQPTCYDIIE